MKPRHHWLLATHQKYFFLLKSVGQSVPEKRFVMLNETHLSFSPVLLLPVVIIYRVFPKNIRIDRPTSTEGFK